MGGGEAGGKEGGERERGTSFNFHPGSGEISVAAQSAERKDGSATKGRRGPPAEAREGRGARRGAGFGPGVVRARSPPAQRRRAAAPLLRAPRAPARPPGSERSLPAPPPPPPPGQLCLRKL